jgi:uncharacterized membrane protein
MAKDTINSPFDCPKCDGQLNLNDPENARCTACQWHGQVYAFSPPPLVVIKQSEAMPDDAACVHHPSKRAVATCAGSGDYICSLCMVEIDGQTFGAAYLATAGKAKASRAFDRYIARPDTHIVTAIVWSYVLCFFVIPTLIGIPAAIYQFLKVRKLRREDPLYAKIVSRNREFWLGVVVVVASVLSVPLLIAVILQWYSSSRSW